MGGALPRTFHVTGHRRFRNRGRDRRVSPSATASRYRVGAVRIAPVTTVASSSSRRVTSGTSPLSAKIAAVASAWW